MKISLRWLSEYVDVSEFFEKPELLASLLTGAGLEVEGVENKSKQYHNVVVGHILERNQHPDADRLTVCQVTTGGGVVHQIVCGAKNHKAGDRVVVSLPGAVLPGNFEIKKSKIRGVESMGMLCSEVELGLAKESEGIMILPADAPIGKSFAEFAGLDDVIFDIKVTANRADCLSHYGLAREVGCLLDREVGIEFEPIQTGGGNTQDLIKLEVQDAEGCPRYAGRFVQGVKVGPSPEWLKRRLEAVGMNSINNIVDVTNFVMMETGQPLHAFDVSFIKGRKISVARAIRGEKFTSLDGSEFELDGSELMIRDAEHAVAMAGVVGGKNSGVQDTTKDVFIECAYFSPATVRRSARRHGIQTDSAYRFSRGVDPDAIMFALNRASELMVKVAGGEILGNHYDVYPHPLKKQPVLINLKQVSQKLGFDANADEFQKWMKRLHCQVEAVSEGEWRVTPPTYRTDLEIREDLIEEYARLKGYDAIPEAVPVTHSSPTPHANTYGLTRLLSKKFQAEGFLQALNFAFVGSKFETQILGDRSKLKSLGLDIALQSVKVKNPLNEDLDVMRSSLTPGLIQNAVHNSRYGANVGRLFEIGYVFDHHDSVYVEDLHLGLVAWGQPEDLWNKKTSPLVLEVKAAIENVLKSLNGRNWTWNQVADAPEYVHPGQCASLFYEGKLVGFIGTLHPKWVDEFKIKGPVVVGEFDFSLFMQGQPRIAKQKGISKFPAVDRDLAFVMPKSLVANDVLQAIKKAAGPQLQSVQVFDVYEGAPLDEGSKSLAFRLVYQDSSATLTDEQIIALQKKVVDDVSKKLGISVR